MARRARLADDVVLWRADELKHTKQYGGAPLHFGRGRPPKGHIGFVEALARRTGYSISIVQRILGKRSRSGPAHAPECLSLQQQKLLRRLPRVLLERTVQSAWTAAMTLVNQRSHEESSDPLADERLPARDRLARVMEVLGALSAAPPPAVTSVKQAEATLWRTEITQVADPLRARSGTKPAPDFAQMEACTRRLD